MANGHGGAREGAGVKPKTVADASGEAHILYSKARAKTQTHKAKIAELEERKLAGELMEKTLVEREAAEFAKTVKDSLFALPDRVASLLVGQEEQEILMILKNEIRNTLQGIANELSEKPEAN